MFLLSSQTIPHQHIFEKERGGRIKLSCRYAHLHGMSFTTTKFYEILLRGFRGVALTRIKGTDGLTDRQVKNIIPSATHCVGYNNLPGSIGDVFAA